MDTMLLLVDSFLRYFFLESHCLRRNIRSYHILCVEIMIMKTCSPGKKRENNEAFIAFLSNRLDDLNRCQQEIFSNNMSFSC